MKKILYLHFLKFSNKIFKKIILNENKHTQANDRNASSCGYPGKLYRFS